MNETELPQDYESIIRSVWPSDGMTPDGFDVEDVIWINDYYDKCFKLAGLDYTATLIHEPGSSNFYAIQNTIDLATPCREEAEYDSFVEELADNMKMLYNKQTNPTVYITTIKHKDGIDVFACENEETAFNVMYKWVGVHWSNLIENKGISISLPIDSKERIYHYFNNNMTESYHISILPVIKNDERVKI